MENLIPGDHTLPQGLTASLNATGVASRKRTPLPKYQLFIIMAIQLAEPVTSMVIYPFVNQFVRETGITKGDAKRTGYFAGVIVSVT